MLFLMDILLTVVYLIIVVFSAIFHNTPNLEFIEHLFVTHSVYMHDFPPWENVNSITASN